MTVSAKICCYFGTVFFSYDELSVYEGTTADVGNRQHNFTGTIANLPMSFGPYDSQMLLRFYSDSSTNSAGFNITYTSGMYLYCYTPDAKLCSKYSILK